MISMYQIIYQSQVQSEKFACQSVFLYNQYMQEQLSSTSLTHKETLSAEKKEHFSEQEKKLQEKEQKNLENLEISTSKETIKGSEKLKDHIRFSHDMNERFWEEFWEEYDDDAKEKLTQWVKQLWYWVTTASMKLLFEKTKIEQKKETLTVDDVCSLCMDVWQDIIITQDFSLQQLWMYNLMIKEKYHLEEQKKEELKKATLEFLADMSDKYLEIYEISVERTSAWLVISLTDATWEKKTLTLSSEDCHWLWMSQAKSRFLWSWDGEKIQTLKDLVSQAQKDNEKNKKQTKEKVVVGGEEKQMWVLGEEMGNLW